VGDYKSSGNINFFSTQHQLGGDGNTNAQWWYCPITTVVKGLY
jgi:hypothetical protein